MAKARWSLEVAREFAIKHNYDLALHPEMFENLVRQIADLVDDEIRRSKGPTLVTKPGHW
jgi:hypothetical protein